MARLLGNDSSNAIFWVTSQSVGPWKLHFYPVEIMSMALSIQASFKHIRKSANVMADTKQGVDTEMSLIASVFFFLTSLVCKAGYNAFFTFRLFSGFV